MTDRVLGLLGIARRAGYIVLGAEALGQAAADGQLALVVIADDVSPRRWEKVRQTLGSVPILTYASRSELGPACGKRLIAMAGIRDRGIAQELMKEVQMRHDSGGHSETEGGEGHSHRNG